MCIVQRLYSLLGIQLIKRQLNTFKYLIHQIKSTQFIHSYTNLLILIACLKYPAQKIPCSDRTLQTLTDKPKVFLQDPLCGCVWRH